MAVKIGKEQDQTGNGRSFVKGQSGNPAGRPKGARNRTTMAVDELLEGEAAAITRKAIELALKGEVVALRLVLERIAPLRRGKPVRFDLPLIEQASDVSTALSSILQATALGELTPDEAVTIASVLESKRRAVETADMEARLAALEKATAGTRATR